jgi:hypothetical protein
MNAEPAPGSPAFLVIIVGFASISSIQYRSSAEGKLVRKLTDFSNT